MQKHLFIFLMSIFLVFSCITRDKDTENIAKINIDLKVKRFDREFAKAKPSDLPMLKEAFPYLFPVQYSDSIWIAKMENGLQKELETEVDKVFPDFNKEYNDLELLFKHIKYYFPKYTVPTVVTVISEVDYNNRVILADSLLLIGIDNYLGEYHRFYQNIYKYISTGFNKKFLISDVAGSFAKRVVPRPRDRNFLSQLIYYGRELYVKDKLIPFNTDAQKIGYSLEQMDWAEANEEQIWRYFVSNELLYSTDNKLSQRFLDLVPFSKFNLELDMESPGRIGRYMGWQIVRAFMDKNKPTLQQMLNLSEEEIFKRSNYKPNK